MVGHGGSSAGSYLADPTSLIPSHCVSIVATSILRVKYHPLVPLFSKDFYSAGLNQMQSNSEIFMDLLEMYKTGGISTYCVKAKNPKISIYKHHLC